MKNNTARRIEKRLLAGDVPEPPAELLEKLKQDIPDRLDAGSGSEASEPERGIGRKPAIRLLAASVFLAVVGGVVVYRVMDRVRQMPLATSVEEAVEESVVLEGQVFENEAEELGRLTAPPALREFEVADPEPAEGEAVPPARRVAANEEADLGAVQGLPGRESGTKATAPAPSAKDDLSKDKGKRVQDAPGPASRAEEERQRVLSTSSVRGDADGRAKSEVREYESAEGPLAAAPQPMRKMAEMDEVKSRSQPVSVEVPKPEVVTTPGAAPSTGGTHEPNDEPYGDMFFQSYGVNPFIDTEDDRLSTFGLDVDTGSYTVARSYLQRGHLPPAEAIRVEEFLNYFDYGDPAPRESDFGLTVEGAPSPFAEGPRYKLVRFGLAAREVDALERPYANLVFVIDVSGSMERQNRLGLVRDSLGLLLDELLEGDRVGLVVYGNRGEVLLEPTGDHEAIRSAIGRLRPGGSTNAEEGLVLAYEQARRHYRPDGINRLILCSDGVANVGRTGAESILGRVAQEADRGIELTTVGFGMGNYNDVLMERLADQGDGSYAYVDNLAEARRIFVESLTGTLLTVARDAKIQVEFNPDAVSRYRLLGYENRDVADERFRDDSVDAGEIGAGHRVTALYEVKLAENAPRKAPLATFRLRYHSTATGRVEEFSRKVERRDLVGSWNEAPPSLRLAALVAELAELLKGTYWAREGDLDDVFRRTQALSAELAGDARVAELAALAGRAAELAGSNADPGR